MSKVLYAAVLSTAIRLTAVAGVKLYPVGTILYAHPIRSKSGLITALAGSDGWFCIPRDVEGLQAGATIQVMTHTIG